MEMSDHYIVASFRNRKEYGLYQVTKNDLEPSVYEHGCCKD